MLEPEADYAREMLERHERAYREWVERWCDPETITAERLTYRLAPYNVTRVPGR